MAKKKETNQDLPGKTESQETPASNEPTEADAMQIEAMADLFDSAEETPAEESTEKEPQEGQPPPEKKKADGQAEKKETQAGSPKEGSSEEQEPPVQEENQETTQEEEDLYEVKTSDGIRHVPAKNLIATYQQFHSLQKKHEGLKPILDLAEQTQTPIPALYAFLRYGVQKAMENQSSPGGTASSDKPVGYEGPFKDEEEAKYIQETDPTLFNALQNGWKRNQAILDEIRGLKSSLQERSQTQDKNEKANQFEKILGGFVAKHKEPFGEKGEHLGEFKEFLAKHFYHYPAKEVDEQFLEIALARFAPDYFKRKQAAQSRELIQEQKHQERGLFGESASVRSGVSRPKLNEQQEHMADLFDL